MTVGARVFPPAFAHIGCTFINTRLATVTVIKRTIGGDGVFTIGGSFGSHQVTTSNGIGSFTVPNVEPGPYQLTETPPTGWAASPWGGNCSATGALTIAAGTTNVTCDITNTRQSTVTIDKVTVPSTDRRRSPSPHRPASRPRRSTWRTRRRPSRS